jgi:hypothetical protein
MVGIFHGYVSQNQMVHGLHAPAMETEDPHHAGNSPNSDVILLTFSKKNNICSSTFPIPNFNWRQVWNLLAEA